jgi:chemotaxis family two-component system response regulator Rcp1
MPKQILLVEDNAGDARLLREVLLGVNNSIHLRVVSDGVEAMAFLNRESQYVRAPRPDLILLDLNLPRMDGREVLARMKADPKLKAIPVIILTTSNSEEDILNSYELHASCYVCKPGQLEEFEILVKSINRLWLTEAKFPKRDDDAREVPLLPQVPSLTAEAELVCL